MHLDLGGWPVTLLDTAGIRETSDPVELEGVRRARDRAAAADLVLWLVDASDMAPFSEKPPSAAKMWLIRNKIDLLSVSDNKTESTKQFIPNSEPLSRSNKPLKSMVKKGSTSSNEQEFNTNDPEFNLSATSGEGFDRLLDRLAAYAESFLAGAEQAVVTRARHRHALEEVLAALRRVLPGGLAEDLQAEDLLAEELRIAARALGRLTGRVDVEDILDVIFRDFCIGK